ncbi:MAG: hypothetical protein O9311_08105 [Cytophagales bacterium]|nr:hypothetical protein [Cytophagales bacterium]
MNNHIENTAFVLIDFDNYIDLDTESLDETSLERELKDIFVDSIRSFSGVDVVHFRLYGGWLKEFSQTRRASKIVQMLSNINIFPFINQQEQRIIKGDIELANSLLKVPGITWGNTLTERNGVRRLRINQEALDESCFLNSQSCPPSILYHFTKHKGKTCSVNGCIKIQKDVFKAVEQKMVDTMIACDVITISKEIGIKGIYVLSDDFDHLPSIALASTIKSDPNLKIKLGLKNKNLIPYFQSSLTGLQIEIKHYE